MIINDPMFVLRSIDESVRTYLIDEPGSAAGEAINIVNRTVREDIMLSPGKRKMATHVLAGLGTIIVRQLALQIDALPDCRIRLKVQTIP